MAHERRVLAAWIVGGQLLTLPCLALARRVSYSPLVVALASCAGMVLALLVATGVLMMTASGVGVLRATRGGQVAT